MFEPQCDCCVPKQQPNPANAEMHACRCSQTPNPESMGSSSKPRKSQVTKRNPPLILPNERTARQTVNTLQLLYLSRPLPMIMIHNRRDPHPQRRMTPIPISAPTTSHSPAVRMRVVMPMMSTVMALSNRVAPRAAHTTTIPMMRTMMLCCAACVMSIPSRSSRRMWRRRRRRVAPIPALAMMSLLVSSSRVCRRRRASGACRAWRRMRACAGRGRVRRCGVAVVIGDIHVINRGHYVEGAGAGRVIVAAVEGCAWGKGLAVGFVAAAARVGARSRKNVF